MNRMAKNTVILLAMFVPTIFASAQGTRNELTTDFGARAGIEADYKLRKGLHLGLDGELRTRDVFSTLGRAQVGAGVSYKLNQYFKAGGGYSFIWKKNSSNTWKPRHRLYLDASAGTDVGNFHFGLKERLQFTHSNVGNAYQSTPNSLALKSRVKATYKRLPDWHPYVSAELRVVLNDPSCSAIYNSATGEYSEYVFNGYTDTYLNRVRGIIGTEWRIDKEHSLDLFLLADYNYDKNIDTNRKGTTLKSLTYDRGLTFQLGIRYSFGI